ncbi:hypothetical protein OHV66_02055 [Acinetobacter baumannii]|nr:hypothetical protein [Acinetobacter baumannii]
MLNSLNRRISFNVYFWCFSKQKSQLQDKLKLRKLWLIF